MDAEIKQEFENLAVIIADSFGKVDKQFEDIRATMATKDDIARVETRLDGVETRLDGVETRLGSLEAKLDFVKSEIENVKVALEILSQRDKADSDAMVGEIMTMKRRVSSLENQVKELMAMVGKGQAAIATAE